MTIIHEMRWSVDAELDWINADRQLVDAGLCALAQWEAVLPGLLPKFKGQLANGGIGIHVGRTETGPVLAYVVMGDPGPVC
jgi:hypothetical protein